LPGIEEISGLNKGFCPEEKIIFALNEKKK